MKTTIWDLASKLGPKPEAILRDIEKLCREDAPLEGEFPPGSRTIKRVIEELQTLRTDVLATLAPHVWHLRNDYVLIADELERLSGNQLHQLDPLTLKRAEEHQQDMLRLVQRWRDELSPPLWQNPIRDLGVPGIHWSTDIQKREHFYWQVEDGGVVYLCYPLEVDAGTETAIIRDYLHQHLRSSDYSWLLDDDEKKGIQKWKSVGGQELAKRRELLRTIDKATRRMTRLAPRDRGDIAGPTRSFSDTIWAAAVDGVYRGFTYHPPEWNAEVGLYRVGYGAFAIALAATKEEGVKYDEWHKKLMVTFEKQRLEKHSLVWEVVNLKGKRESVTKAIQKALAKLTVDRFIPGRCEGCPTSGLLPHQQG